MSLASAFPEGEEVRVTGYEIGAQRYFEAVSLLTKFACGYFPGRYASMEKASDNLRELARRIRVVFIDACELPRLTQQVAVSYDRIFSDELMASLCDLYLRSVTGPDGDRLKVIISSYDDAAFVEKCGVDANGRAKAELLDAAWAAAAGAAALSDLYRDNPHVLFVLHLETFKTRDVGGKESTNMYALGLNPVVVLEGAPLEAVGGGAGGSTSGSDAHGAGGSGRGSVEAAPPPPPAGPAAGGAGGAGVAGRTGSRRLSRRFLLGARGGGVEKPKKGKAGSRRGGGGLAAAASTRGIAADSAPPGASPRLPPTLAVSPLVADRSPGAL